MKFRSTRGDAEVVNATEAVLRGIAPDGGLYMVDGMDYTAFDWKELMGKSTQEMAVKVIGFFLDDFQDMEGIVKRAYTGKFDTEELVNVVPVGDRYVMELFHGPTSAFKDVALSVLPQLIVAARKQEGRTGDIVILTATSGDTGKAALEGFHDVDGIRIIVFFPNGGVSAVQKAQMVTQEGKNVTSVAVVGNFDDTQTGVKKIFTYAANEGLPEDLGVSLSSANSINIGRLVPQIVYYFKAYSELLRMEKISEGDLVDFTVPTGNFGDILAGYLAKLLGLPVGRLICASNANNVLSDFIRTGVYDRNREFYKTESPSMDILISSNLERLLYMLSGSDSTLVKNLMQELSEKGVYTAPEDLMKVLQTEFACGYADDKVTEQTISDVWKQNQYLMDTHTAVAWAVASDYMKEAEEKRPNVVLSTASAYKFPKAVLQALGETASSDEFEIMNQLHALTGVPVPKNLSGLSEKPVRFTDVVEKDDMMNYVIETIRKGNQAE